MKKYSSLSLSGAFFLLAPFVVSAQDSAGPTTFAGSYTLWIAIIIGIIGSLMVFYYSQQMGDSTVGGILRLFGGGMFIVVLGFISVAVAWADAPIQKIVHDLLFILGYFLMLAGATRLKKLSI